MEGRGHGAALPLACRMALPMASIIPGGLLSPSASIRSRRRRLRDLSISPADRASTRRVRRRSVFQSPRAAAARATRSIADGIAAQASASLCRQALARMNTRRRRYGAPMSLAANSTRAVCWPSRRRSSAISASHCAFPGGCSTTSHSGPTTLRMRLTSRQRLSPFRPPWMAAATLVRWHGGPATMTSASLRRPA